MLQPDLNAALMQLAVEIPAPVPGAHSITAVRGRSPFVMMSVAVKVTPQAQDTPWRGQERLLIRPDRMGRTLNLRIRELLKIRPRSVSRPNSCRGWHYWLGRLMDDVSDLKKGRSSGESADALPDELQGTSFDASFRLDLA